MPPVKLKEEGFPFWCVPPPPPEVPISTCATMCNIWNLEWEHLCLITCLKSLGQMLLFDLKNTQFSLSIRIWETLNEDLYYASTAFFWGWAGGCCLFVSSPEGLLCVSCGSRVSKEAEHSALTIESSFGNLLSWVSELIRCQFIIYQEHF